MKECYLEIVHNVQLLKQLFRCNLVLTCWHKCRVTYGLDMVSRYVLRHCWIWMLLCCWF